MKDLYQLRQKLTYEDFGNCSVFKTKTGFKVYWQDIEIVEFFEDDGILHIRPFANEIEDVRETSEFFWVIADFLENDDCKPHLHIDRSKKNSKD